MNRFFSISSILLLFIMHAGVTFALPRFALMGGMKCGSCHINPTGGQMRNEYGSKFSLESLPLEATKDDDFSFNAKLNDNISIGGDYRSELIYDGASKNSSFQAMTTTLYGAVTLSKKISFYFKQDLINGSYNGLYGGAFNGTEVYGIARVLPNGGFIKGGAFLPDYGWRLDDHTAYTRGGDMGFTGAGFHPGLIFVPNYQDIGIEVGSFIDDFLVTAGLFNGSGHLNPIKVPFDKEFAYTGKIEYHGSFSSVNFRVGASGYGYKSFKMGGATIGFATGDIVVMGEVDWTHQNLNATTTAVNVIENMNSMALYTELDYRAIQGVWLIGKYELFDPQQGLGDDPTASAFNSIKRATVGLEFFPYSFVEVRPQYRINMETPSINNDLALVQMHLWF